MGCACQPRATAGATTRTETKKARLVEYDIQGPIPWCGSLHRRAGVSPRQVGNFRQDQTGPGEGTAPRLRKKLEANPRWGRDI